MSVISDFDLSPEDPRGRRWLWYALRTPDCVPLDHLAYPSIVFDRCPMPHPSWACTAPNGGVHASGAVGQIDVDVTEPPNPQDEWSWTCDYILPLLADSWLTRVRDLVSRDKIHVGLLRVNGEPLKGWATLHEGSPPPRLLATRGHGWACPTCGRSYTVLHGREYFADPAVLQRVMIVNANGIFVREDIALSRDLPTPRGAYDPALVLYEPELA